MSGQCLALIGGNRKARTVRRAAAQASVVYDTLGFVALSAAWLPPVRRGDLRSLAHC